MSILITGLEMPTERESLNLTIKYNGTVFDTETGMQVAEAHELPPYGDLVDRNEMFVEFVVEGQKSTRYKVGEKWELNGEEIRRVIQRLPTIIPAEGEK